MEFIGAIVVVVIVFVGIAFLVKHQKGIGWWMQTPHYDDKYKRKMLNRQIEDAQEELDRLESKKK